MDHPTPSSALVSRKMMLAPRLLRLAAAATVIMLGRIPTEVTAVGCKADQDCLSNGNAIDFRCLQTSPSNGTACTLDYGYNTTGFCACAAESCLDVNYPPPTPGLKQYLIIGDSISMGYEKQLKLNLSGTHQVIHAPGNNGNTNWGRHCVTKWLGSDPTRWDAVTFNFGLHDLAFPDNEHVNISTYSQFIIEIANILITKTRASSTPTKPKTQIIFVTTTPVPTDPPNDPVTGKSCELIPGRKESDVEAYNKAAGMSLAGFTCAIKFCDVFSMIENHCGAGYRSCDISQCAGPHYTENGFMMLGNFVAQCVAAATTSQTECTNGY